MALAVNDELVQDAASRLARGGWKYTLRQLYYATCAEAEIPPNHAAANGELALGALLVLVALILIHFRVVFAALFSVAAVLILLGIVQRYTRRPPPVRVLAISFADFVQRFGAAYREGLIPPDAPADAPPPDGADAVVVCDTEETARAVVANLDHAGLHAGVTASPGSLGTAAPSLLLATLHDASPRGCALPLDLRDAGARVVDCGLRPAWVDSPACQVIEGAPARLPRPLEPLLDDAEIAWLVAGRRVEVATLHPERLMSLVDAALAGAAERLPGIVAG